jgi:hypothetical protein
MATIYVKILKTPLVVNLRLASHGLVNKIKNGLAILISVLPRDQYLSLSTSFKCGPHAPELCVEFQALPVSWTVRVVASILCSHEICLEYALLVVGSTSKSRANFAFIPNFPFPKYSTRISPKSSSMDPPKIITVAKV